MDQPPPSWDLYRTFYEVARDGSLSGAARLLGLTQPTAGRHIDALERALGVSLFIRSRRGLEATTAAHELLPHVEAMVSAHNAVLRAASGDVGEQRGAVRITASEIISAEVLPGIIEPFCDQHRGVAVELVSSNRLENLLRRDCDIAIRMQRPAQDALISKRIGFSRVGLYAHRSYVEKRGLISSVNDLARHRLIGFDRDNVAVRVPGLTIEPIKRDQFGFRTDSFICQLAALRAGIGIGVCQTAIAARDPDMIAVLPGQFEYNLEVWVAAHEKLKPVKRVRLLFDALCDGLRNYLHSNKV
jgi:DNA-binding transcriptional LysR family regulator